LERESPDAGRTSGSAEAGRGREAGGPRQIPRRGWGDILVRVRREVGDDNLSMISAGVAFYAILALFPAIAALISIYGLIADPNQVEQQVQAASDFLPQEVMTIIEGQMQSVASHPAQALGLGVAAGILFALWSATKGTKSMITALNIVYEEEEHRGFFKLNAVAFLLTLFTIVLAVVTLAVIVVLPVVLGMIGLGSLGETLVQVLRWPILGALVVFTLAVLYRYGPSRHKARWRWTSWGALGATLLWLVASWLFSLYVANFGDYGATYGSVGAVIVLLLWLYVSAFVVLLGAEVNAEMEHQTERDSTVGGDQPMGKRGARMADTAGRRR
jgi:membrane protein